MQKVRFFLDYGQCFWPVHPDLGQDEIAKDTVSSLAVTTKDSLLMFLSKYDQSYSWGFPPSCEWTTLNCIIFNNRLRELLKMIQKDTSGKFLICVEQLYLTEDASVLENFRVNGNVFVREWIANHYVVLDSL